MEQFFIKKDKSGNFKRERNQEDMKYRRIHKATFAEKLGELLSKDSSLCFHGTPIWNAEAIIKSGQLSAEIDRKGDNDDVLDMAGFVSVTTIENLWWTVKQFADLSNFDYPAGCIFVIEPKDESEQALARDKHKIANVDFVKEPDRLKKVITTPENVQRVKEWLEKSELDVVKNIVVTYDEFLEKAKNDFQKRDERVL